MTSFETIFDPTTLDRFRKCGLAQRVEELTARDPGDGDGFRSVARSRWIRRRAWERYIASANACGLLDVDLIERLRSPKPDDFRGAIGECLAAHVFADRMGYAITPRPPGKPPKVLDMRATRGAVDLCADVKAPQGRDRSGLTSWSDDDSDAIVSVVRKAASQMRADVANLVVVVPEFTIEVRVARSQIVDALIGQPTLQVPIGGGEPSAGFQPDGRLMRRRLRTGALGEPDNTRVSAVAVIEERWTDSDIEPTMIVVHNHHAEIPIDRAAFDTHPQLVSDGDEMSWTDAARTM